MNNVTSELSILSRALKEVKEQCENFSGGCFDVQTVFVIAKNSLETIKEDFND